MYKLKHSYHRASAIEHTYDEVVVVKKGIATCKGENARRTLINRGYRPIGEIKEVEVKDKSNIKVWEPE